MKRRVALNENGLRIGQTHPLAILSDAEVDLVFELIEAGFSYSQVAEKMGVSKSCIGHIASGRRRCQTPVKWIDCEPKKK